MSPTRIARVERAFVARVIVATAVVGAFIGGGLALYLSCRGFGLPFLRLCDAAVHAIPAGHAMTSIATAINRCSARLVWSIQVRSARAVTRA